MCKHIAKKGVIQTAKSGIQRKRGIPKNIQPDEQATAEAVHITNNYLRASWTIYLCDEKA